MISLMPVSRLIKRYKEIPLPAKASIWFVICSILQRGISFITVPIFTRMMSTEQYGAYSTYISWYSILIVFTSLNLYYGVFNNAMIKYEKSRDKYISSMQGLIIVITGSFFCVYLIFRDIFNNLLGMTTPLVLLLFIELLFTPSLQFWTVHNRFRYKYKNIVIVTLIKSIANPCLGIIFVLLSDQKDLARIISTVLVEVIVCGIIAAYQFYKGKCFFNKEYWKYAVLFNLPLIPHYLSGVILSQSDRIMISNFINDSAVAFYSVASNLAQVLNMFTAAIVSSFTPWLYHELKEKRTSEIHRITMLLLLLMAAVLLIMMFLAPELLSIIAAPAYAEAVYVIPPIAASTFFIFMYNLISNVEFYFEERKFVTIGSITAACANLILNWIFIPRYGYYAAGYTTLLCYMIYSLSHLGFSQIVLKKNLHSDNAFNVRQILGLSIVVLLITILQNFIYSNLILRYALILLLIVVMVLKRQTIIIEIKKCVQKIN